MHTILLLSQEDDFLSQGYHPAEESTVDPELLLEVGPGPGKDPGRALATTAGAGQDSTVEIF